MKKINKVQRWLALLIGICGALIVSDLMPWEDKTMRSWGFVKMLLVTASGPFGGMVTLFFTAREKAIVMGILKIC